MTATLMRRVWRSKYTKNLLPSQLLILLGMALHADDQGIVQISVPKIAKLARLKKRITYTHLAFLRESGYIRYVHHSNGGQGIANTYRVWTINTRR